MKWIKRLVHRMKGVCRECGDEPVKGTPMCWACSLGIIEDYDETLCELVVTLTEKPSYFEEENE